MKRLFLDSNVLLQFRYQEIDWCAVVSTKDVELVVVAEVLREIENYKDQGPERLQRRARTASSWIVQAMRTQNGIVRPGVRLVVDLKHPRREELEALGLNPDVNDDKILASILKEEGGHDRILVTADTLLTLKAEHHGLGVLFPPEDKKHPPEPNPLEEENKRLRKQLDERPKIAFGFRGQPSPVTGKLFVFDQLEEAHLDEVIDEERSCIGQNSLSAAMRATTHHSPSEQVQTQYLARFRGWLTEHFENIRRNRLTTTVDLELRNEGRGTATDIEVQLTASPPVLLVRPSRVEVPPPPERPQWRSKFTPIGNSAFFADMEEIRSRRGGITFGIVTAQETAGRPYASESEPHKACFHLRELKHTSSYQIAVQVWFDDADAALATKSFFIKYRVHAACPPDILSGEIHVKVAVLRRPLSAYDVRT